MLLLSAPGVNVIAPLVGGLIEGQVSISVWACVSLSIELLAYCKQLFGGDKIAHIPSQVGWLPLHVPVVPHH